MALREAGRRPSSCLVACFLRNLHLESPFSLVPSLFLSSTGWLAPSLSSPAVSLSFSLCTPCKRPIAASRFLSLEQRSSHPHLSTIIFACVEPGHRPAVISAAVLVFTSVRTYNINVISRRGLFLSRSVSISPSLSLSSSGALFLCLFLSRPLSPSRFHITVLLTVPGDIRSRSI